MNNPSMKDFTIFDDEEDDTLVSDMIINILPVPIEPEPFEDNYEQD